MFCACSPFAVAWDCHVNRLSTSVADWLAVVEYLLYPVLVGLGGTGGGVLGWHQLPFQNASFLSGWVMVWDSSPGCLYSGCGACSIMSASPGLHRTHGVVVPWSLSIHPLWHLSCGHMQPLRGQRFSEAPRISAFCAFSRSLFLFSHHFSVRMVMVSISSYCR